MNIVDAIFAARDQHLRAYRTPVRIWLSSEHFCEFICDPRISQNDLRAPTFMGMILSEDRLSQWSRMVSDDGTAVDLVGRPTSDDVGRPGEIAP